MERKNTAINLWGTPVRIELAFLANLVALWAMLTWAGWYWHPGRSVGQAVLIAFVAMVTLLVADVGHAIAHIQSANWAGAPMDLVLISMGMPRTIYSDDHVPPAVHRKRAIGGPIFSAVGTILSLVVYLAASDGGLLSEWAGWSLIGHGFILLGSLAPLPMVDGGTILKWTLVERGRSEPEADEIVRRISWVIAALALTAGVVLALFGLWLAGLAALAVAGIFGGAALGKLK
jgi:hypothetical protein